MSFESRARTGIHALTHTAAAMDRRARRDIRGSILSFALVLWLILTTALGMLGSFLTRSRQMEEDQEDLV